MTALFDGMAGVLNDVFGAPVTIYPGGGAGVVIQGVIRDVEIEVAGEHGEVVVTIATTLKALKSDVDNMIAGDQIEQGPLTFKVRYRQSAESPAVDRFETFVLEKV